LGKNRHNLLLVVNVIDDRNKVIVEADGLTAQSARGRFLTQVKINALNAIC